MLGELSRIVTVSDDKSVCIDVSDDATGITRRTLGNHLAPIIAIFHNSIVLTPADHATSMTITVYPAQIETLPKRCITLEAANQTSDTHDGGPGL